MCSWNECKPLNNINTTRFIVHSVIVIEFLYHFSFFNRSTIISRRVNLWIVFLYVYASAVHRHFLSFSFLFFFFNFFFWGVGWGLIWTLMSYELLFNYCLQMESQFINEVIDSVEYKIWIIPMNKTILFMLKMWWGAAEWSNDAQLQFHVGLLNCFNSIPNSYLELVSL